MFNWVVLLIWFAYMLNELRESWKLKMLIWDVPSVSVIDMVIIDKEEGRINVRSISELSWNVQNLAFDHITGLQARISKTLSINKLRPRLR